MNMKALANTAEDETVQPVSAKIRARIQQAKQRFHANDNISSFIAPGEIDALFDEVVVADRKLTRFWGEFQLKIDQGV